MKIALMNEWSQADKNPVIFKALSQVAMKEGHDVFNVGMQHADDHHLTYIHLGIMASLLLNSRAVDFVITGCGTGQGAMMSLNAYPGVVCGYCIEPTDAFLFSQINNGNALSLPFAKGFGWGAELNLTNIFEKAFTGERGQGYPRDKKDIQNKNSAKLFDIKSCIARPYNEVLGNLEKDLLRHAVSGEEFARCLREQNGDVHLISLLDTLIC